MKRTSIVAAASVACLLAMSCYAASDLTRAQAKEAFETVAAADSPTTTLTFSVSQIQRLKIFLLICHQKVKHNKRNRRKRRDFGAR